MKSVRLSVLAQSDIRGLVEDIARDKPSAAAAFGRQLIQRCHSLANAPEGYALRPNLARMYGPSPFRRTSFSIAFDRMTS